MISTKVLWVMIDLFMIGLAIVAVNINTDPIADKAFYVIIGGLITEVVHDIKE